MPTMTRMLLQVIRKIVNGIVANYNDPQGNPRPAVAEVRLVSLARKIQSLLVRHNIDEN